MVWIIVGPAYYTLDEAKKCINKNHDVGMWSYSLYEFMRERGLHTGGREETWFWSKVDPAEFPVWPSLVLPREGMLTRDGGAVKRLPVGSATNIEFREHAQMDRDDLSAAIRMFNDGGLPEFDLEAMRNECMVRAMEV